MIVQVLLKKSCYQTRRPSGSNSCKKVWAPLADVCYSNHFITVGNKNPDYFWPNKAARFWLTESVCFVRHKPYPLNRALYPFWQSHDGNIFPGSFLKVCTDPCIYQNLLPSWGCRTQPHSDHGTWLSLNIMLPDLPTIIISTLFISCLFPGGSLGHLQTHMPAKEKWCMSVYRPVSFHVALLQHLWAGVRDWCQPKWTFRLGPKLQMKF